jgi:hypothetical protein
MLTVVALGLGVWLAVGIPVAMILGALADGRDAQVPTGNCGRHRRAMAPV